MAKNPSSSPAGSWVEVFQSLVCRLYREFGGDCSSLGWSDGGGSAVAAVRSAFESNGLPTFPSPSEQQAFEDLLDDLEAHINLPGATITPAVKTAVQSLIDDIRDLLTA